MRREKKRGKGKEGKREKRARVLTAKRARVATEQRHDATLKRKRATRDSSFVPTARTAAIIGAGRLGSALGLALAAAGYQITSLVTADIKHARRGARLFASPRPRALAATQLASLPRASLFIIATPDDQITATAAQLASVISTHDAQPRNDAPIALHTSGALSSDALAVLRARGFAVGSLHPLVSVSDARAGAQSLRGAFYCIEGDAAAVKVARRIVRALGGRSFSIKPKDKALYHAAAVLAAGHTVALFDLAATLLARCGVVPAAARRALLPLTTSTLTNLLNAQTTAHALTGPFARGDAATVRRNLAALADPTARQIYALLGAQALSLAQQRGLDAASVAELKQALTGKEKN